MSLNWNFQRGGGGVQTKKNLLWGGVWIFSGTTHCKELNKEQLSKCAAFFDQFFSWSFQLNLKLPRLVVLRCVVLRFVVCFVLRRVVL